MLPPSENGLVGLIELSAASAAEAASDDATLGGLLRRLAGSPAARSEPTATLSTARRIARGNAAVPAVRVVADCHTLGDQLDRVAVELRRRLAGR